MLLSTVRSAVEIIWNPQRYW